MKKIILCLLLCFSVLGLSSCKITSYKDMKELKYKNLLNQKADNYYVVFYAVGCAYCAELESTVVNYAKYAKTNKDAYPIYVLNLSDKKKNAGINATNDNEYPNFLGTTNYEDIHFTTAPALIMVSKGMVVRVISSKSTMRPMSEIKELLTSQMEDLYGNR